MAKPQGAFLTPKATKIIRSVMKKRGVNQKKLGQKIKKSNVAHYLTSRNSIDDKIAGKIYSALGRDRELKFLGDYSASKTYQTLEEYLLPQNPTSKSRTFLAPFYDRIDAAYRCLNSTQRGQIVAELERILERYER